jgi:ribosomal protein L11 methyltransferase
LRRVSVEVPLARAEEARARMLELFPEGFEEVEQADGVEFVAYTEPSGEERLWHAFGAVSASEVEPGWEDGWRRFHRPVRVGSLWVGPPWEEAPADAISVVVDPGRAFGTGAHPTTRLCLELLEREARTSVLDVGCGSGVLAIAAAKLGFAPVAAVDSALEAVDATRRNAAVNAVEIEVARANAVEDELPAADVVLANIELGAVQQLGNRLRAKRLISSGYLAADEPELATWTRIDRRERDGWAADLFRRAD